MIQDDLLSKAYQFAYDEIDKYGLPTRIHFDLSIKKGIEIANALNVDNKIVQLGICFMDIKLGEAFKEKRLAEHVKMSSLTSKEFLNDFDIPNDIKDIVINSIEAHHGTIPFTHIEAEIVANADCYRFIHPQGVFHYIGTLTKRGLNISEIIDGAESKLDEKYKILSLEYCKKELDKYYHEFKEMFSISKTL